MWVAYAYSLLSVGFNHSPHKTPHRKTAIRAVSKSEERIVPSPPDSADERPEGEEWQRDFHKVHHQRGKTPDRMPQHPENSRQDESKKLQDTNDRSENEAEAEARDPTGPRLGYITLEVIVGPVVPFAFRSVAQAATKEKKERTINQNHQENSHTHRGD
jgi:hypothetical protein